jgi:hypothetical protein
VGDPVVFLPQGTSYKAISSEFFPLKCIQRVPLGEQMVYERHAFSFFTLIRNSSIYSGDVPNAYLANRDTLIISTYTFSLI